MASPRLSPASPATTCCSILAPSSPSSSRPWQGPCAPPSMPDGRRAVFLDRDGTIVDDPSPGLLHEPGRVRLLPGAAEPCHRRAQARALGVPLVPDLAAAVDAILHGVEHRAAVPEERD